MIEERIEMGWEGWDYDDGIADAIEGIVKEIAGERWVVKLIWR